MHSAFGGAIPEQIFAPRPPPATATRADVDAAVERLDALVSSRSDDIAALIVEPLVQGAGGDLPARLLRATWLSIERGS